jgi:hypothetical protein
VKRARPIAPAPKRVAFTRVLATAPGRDKPPAGEKTWRSKAALRSAQYACLDRELVAESDDDTAKKTARTVLTPYSPLVLELRDRDGRELELGPVLPSPVRRRELEDVADTIERAWRTRFGEPTVVAAAELVKLRRSA